MSQGFGMLIVPGDPSLTLPLLPVKHSFSLQGHMEQPEGIASRCNCGSASAVIPSPQHFISGLNDVDLYYLSTYKHTYIRWGLFFLFFPYLPIVVLFY